MIITSFQSNSSDAVREQHYVVISVFRKSHASLPTYTYFYIPTQLHDHIIYITTYLLL